MAKNDLELLEFAAKALGEEFHSGHITLNGQQFEWVEWNPLTDDGDALSLAVKLNMSVDVDEYEASTYAYAGPKHNRQYAWELWGDDKSAATRRAIVRAAVEVTLAALNEGKETK